MNDLKKKLLQLNETKEMIRDAIVDREVAVPEGTPFRDYANRIRAIPLGGVAALNIAYGDTAPADTSKLWVKGDAPKAVEISTGGNATKASTEVNFGALAKWVSCTKCAAVGNKIYICGGYIGNDDPDYAHDLLVYDADKNTSEYYYKFLYGHGGEMYGSVVAAGENVFVLGGVHDGYFANSIIKIDTKAMEASTIGQLDQYCAYAAAAAVGEKIYLIGGQRKDQSYIGDPKVSDRISVIDARSGACQTLAHKLPTAMFNAKAVTFDKTIYVFGGYDGTAGLNTIYAIDTAETDYGKAIRLLDTKMPLTSWACDAERIGRYIYYFYYTLVYRFDPETETIVSLGALVPNAATNRCVAAVGNSAYIMGGDGVSGSPATYDDYRKTVDKFTVETGLEENTLLIETDATGQQIDLVKMANLNMRLGIRGVYRGNSEGIAEKAQAYLWGIRDVLHGYEAAAQVSSGTELTAEVEAKAGQLVIAAIAARDSFTLSEGWTLISTSEINSTDTMGQRLAFAYKYAAADSESITVTQASEQRLYINLLALQGATGFTDNGYTYKNTATEATITAAKPAGLTLWACSAPLWRANEPYPQWAADNDPYRIDLGDKTQSRLAIFLDQSDAEQVIFTAGANSTAIVGCLTIAGMTEFYEHDGSGWCEF